MTSLNKVLFKLASTRSEGGNWAHGIIIYDGDVMHVVVQGVEVIALALFSHFQEVEAWVWTCFSELIEEVFLFFY